MVPSSLESRVEMPWIRIKINRPGAMFIWYQYDDVLGHSSVFTVKPSSDWPCLYCCLLAATASCSAVNQLISHNVQTRINVHLTRNTASVCTNHCLLVTHSRSLGGKYQSKYCPHLGNCHGSVLLHCPMSVFIYSCCLHRYITINTHKTIHFTLPLLCVL